MRKGARQVVSGVPLSPFLIPLPAFPTFSPVSPNPSVPSIDPRLDDLRERVSRAVEPRFHRAEVAVRDLSDFLVRLALELAQHEHLAVMLGQLCHGLGDQLPQMPLAVEIVRTRCRVLELQRT